MATVGSRAVLRQAHLPNSFHQNCRFHNR
jgi:hypothetical protein